MSIQKRTISRLVSVVSIIAFIYFYVSITQHSITPTHTIAGLNGCTIQNNYCEFIDEQQNFEVTFLTSPEVEEETLVQIVSNQAFEIENAWIEGVDMYMGKTPVIWQTIELQRAKGVFFLGSCNQATMQWRLIIEFKQKTHPYGVRFSTVQF